MKIYLDEIDQNTKKYLFGIELGIPYEETTPEWNIEHYSTLVKYTKNLVLRKKHQKNLDWWLDAKSKRDNVRELIRIPKGE